MVQQGLKLISSKCDTRQRSQRICLLYVILHTSFVQARGNESWGGEEIGVGSRLWKGAGWNLEGWFQNNFLLISYQYYISINLKDNTQVRPRLFTSWIPVDFTVCQWTFIFLPVDTCWLIVLITGKMAVENDLWQLKLWNSKSASVDFIHRLFFALGCM